MHLTLIRHASSNHIQSGRISGIKSCTGLSEEGYTQASLLADRFRRTGEQGACQVLLSSPVLRARQTAEIIVPALPWPTPIFDPDLVEQRPGDADGLTYPEYRERYGDFNSEKEPTRLFAPNGESWLGFLERVNETLERLSAQYAGQNVIAVTHAGFIVGTFIVLFDLFPSDHPTRFGLRAFVNPENTSLTEWRKENKNWVLETYNDISHLKSV